MRSARQQTHALLRAHLSAAARAGHRTERCRACRHLLDQAMRLPPSGPRLIAGPSASGPNSPSRPATRGRNLDTARSEV
ncbi:DUF6274 family protein [Wenjunlia vitaminophila]|uniref:DUF6274 family protein n=1 Tax=Wenjunlia vitaminophila TaxID=76728 RepID=UPI000B2A80EB|nr:DUF6274 family protein [Wenjunlia vitaminophila]